MLHSLRHLLFMFLFALLISFPAIAREAPPADVDAAAAAELIKQGNVKVLDVRTPAEYRAGHIEGAENLNLFGGDFDMAIRKLPADDILLVYCKSGKRSAAAAQELKKAGYENVVNMRDGMDGWQKAGLPVVK